MHDLTTSNALTDLAARIRGEHENACVAARATIEHAFRVGELLLQAKQIVQHGYWGDWLHVHCDLSERSAQNYMRLARHRANPQLTADFTIDDALKALAKPMPVEIDAANAANSTIVDCAAVWLPSEGQARIGFLDDRNVFETFGVIEDEHHPGFYRIAHTEDHGGENGGFTEPMGGRPIRGDFVRTLFEHYMRRPDLFHQIEWQDFPAANWPFPMTSPRWPKY